MHSKPCEVWAKMRNVQAGHNLHHKTTNHFLNFAMDGIKATNNEENLKIVCKHFKKVYNMESSYDLSIIDNSIPQ
jgi:hypothetical protein